MSTFSDPIADTKAIKDARGVLAQKRNELHEIFEQAGEGLDASRVKVASYGSGSELRDDVKARSTELDTLQESLQGLLEIEGLSARTPTSARRPERRSGRSSTSPPSPARRKTAP